MVHGGVTRSRTFWLERKNQNCLSDVDIDRALQCGVPEAYISARMAHDFCKGTKSFAQIRTQIDRRLKNTAKVFWPILVRHHWVLVTVERDGNGRYLCELFDSAPSPEVTRDVEWIISRPLAKYELTIHLCPHQLRESNECGLHVITNVAAIVNDNTRWFAHQTMSLKKLRKTTNLWDAAFSLTQVTTNQVHFSQTTIVGGAEFNDATDSHIRNTLMQCIPGSTIKVTWRFFGEDTVHVWLGRVHQSTGRGNALNWPIGYRIIDEDGDVASIASQWPRPPRYRNCEVEIITIEVHEAELTEPELHRHHREYRFDDYRPLQRRGDSRPRTTNLPPPILETVGIMSKEATTARATNLPPPILETVGTMSKEATTARATNLPTPIPETVGTTSKEATTARAATPPRSQQRNDDIRRNLACRDTSAKRSERALPDIPFDTESIKRLVSGRANGERIRLWLHVHGSTTAERLEGTIGDHLTGQITITSPANKSLSLYDDSNEYSILCIEFPRTGKSPKGPSHKEVLVVDIDPTVEHVEEVATSSQPQHASTHAVTDVDAITSDDEGDRRQAESLSVLLHDAMPGAMVHSSTVDSLIDLFIGDERKAFGVGYTTTTRLPKRPSVTPIFFEKHFALLVVDEGGSATVFDSVPQHAMNERREKVLSLTGTRKFQVVNTGPQKTNECGFRTVRALLQVLGKSDLCPGEDVDLRGFFMDRLIATRKQPPSYAQFLEDQPDDDDPQREFRNHKKHTSEAPKVAQVATNTAQTEQAKPQLTDDHPREREPSPAPHPPVATNTVTLPTYQQFLRETKPPILTAKTLEKTPDVTRSFTPEPERVNTNRPVTEHTREAQTTMFSGLQRHTTAQSIFEQLQRRTTAQSAVLIDNGQDREFLADTIDPDAELACIELAYPITNENAQQLVLNQPTNVAGLTFKHIREAVNAKTASPHPLAVKALAPATRDEHRRVLELIRLAPTNYDTWSGEKGLLEILAQTKKQRKWKFTTLAKKSC